MIKAQWIVKFSWGVAFWALILMVGGCGSHVYHQVEKGDTLYSISWRYSQNYHDVAKWNDIEPPYIIHAGQWVRVAPPGRSKKSVKVAHQVPVRDLTTASISKPTINTQSSSKPIVVSIPAEPKQERYIPPISIKEIDKSAEVVSSKPAPIVVSSSRDPIQWRWPVLGTIVEGYSSKRPGKKGIGIGGRRGNPIKAAAGGKVVYSGNSLKGYGNLIIIKHNDKYLSAYGHNQTLLVQEGDHVTAGQLIAKMGDTEAGQVKLHFEIRIDGKPANPLRYLPKRGS